MKSINRARQRRKAEEKRFARQQMKVAIGKANEKGG